ncbi:MAG: hypothetical protein A3K10_01855 [Bacteroidetes bacterium RIFCSPLOWO2_12_FULL_31_6]|nr:MAG: hypothetical protein A3K10_01855 [Bacteroidetes bacterium RIFCSPLOWO2_12_FULL_31_6]
MKKKLLYILLFSIGSTSIVCGQTNENKEDDYVIAGYDYVIPFDSLKTKDKIHYGFTMGAGFGSSSSFGNYFQTYYKPTISFDVTSRLSIKTGIAYVNSSAHNLPVLSDDNYQLFSGNISQYYVFVGGQYKLTDKLSVGGSIFYDASNYSTFDGTSLGKSAGLSDLGYSVNFQYKVRDGLYIEGEIRINDKNPYHQNSSFFSNGLIGAEHNFFGR